MTIDEITHKLIEIGAEVNDKQAEQILDIVVALGEIEKSHKVPQCEDAISRQAVLDIINADWKYEGMEQYINDLPPVKPKAKTGHWISYSWDDNGIARWGLKCDICNKKYKYGGELWNDPNFCPNCGAKMESNEKLEHGLDYADAQTLRSAT